MRDCSKVEDCPAALGFEIAVDTMMARIKMAEARALKAEAQLAQTDTTDDYRPVRVRVVGEGERA